MAGVNFDARSAKRIAAQVKRNEREYQGGGIPARAQGPREGAGGATGMMFARLPSGGIASGATGTVTFYSAWNTLGSNTATVRNQWATAAPSLKKCVVGRVAGVAEIAIISWDCS
jgi:hypothetical protein